MPLKNPFVMSFLQEKPLPIELVQGLLETGRSHVTIALFVVTTHEPGNLLLVS